jgi:DNA-binding winged helix-turn-helix (wHTH) protein/Tfp pilus assembly protein PilF
MKPLASKQSQRLYEFGPFRLDPEERLLLRNQELVALTPKAFDTLVVLIENSGRLLEKDDLMQAVWPDTFVDENTLTSNISTLRKALGQSKGGQYIETVPKRGYRFVANVRELQLEAGDLLVQKRTRSHITIKEEQTVASQEFKDDGSRHSSLRQHHLVKTLLGVRSNRIVIAASIVLIGTIVAALAWESNRKAARAAGIPRNEAYQAYLDGRVLWNKRTGEALFKSISYFEEAVKKDPGFALGYAGLADAYAFDYEHWRKAEAMASKAIEMDDALAEPHATLGFIRMFWQWSWADAEMEFKRAIELNPGYATAHQWYAIWLASQANGQGAMAEMHKALELDPSSLPIKADMAQMFYFAHGYDQAIKACKDALDIDPDFINAHDYLHQAYTQKGMHVEAVEEFFTFHKLVGDGLYNDPVNEEMLRTAFATEGITGFCKANLDILMKRNEYAYTKAEYYSLLGEKEQAIDWLEKSFEWHNFDFVFMKVNPAFEGLRKEPRYRSLLLRSGLVSPDSAR